jgi:cell filamentation protein
MKENSMNLSASSSPVSGEVETTVRELAFQHGITADREMLDDWGDRISYLSGEDGEPADEIEQLIIALARAKVIEDSEAIELELQYMRPNTAEALVAMSGFDPFGDFSTRGYLQNFFGIKDLAKRKAVERTVVQINLPIVMETLRSRKQLSYGDILSAHKQLFQKVYPWAGQDRTVTSPGLDISKAGIHDIFARPEHIRMAMDHGLRLASKTEIMRSKAGTVMGYLAHSHPFLEGNGRTIMIVHQEMCRRAGFHTDWMETDQANYLTVLTEELLNPDKGLLDRYLTPKIVARPLSMELSAKTTLTNSGLIKPGAERTSDDPENNTPAQPAF